MRELPIRCEHCVRGIVRAGEWGYPCTACKGRGGFTVNEIATRIDEWPKTVGKLLGPKRMRRATAARLLDKLLKIASEKPKASRVRERQGSLFT